MGWGGVGVWLNFSVFYLPKERNVVIHFAFPLSVCVFVFLCLSLCLSLSLPKMLPQVRSLLYSSLLHLHVEVSSFRSLSLRLLRRHLVTLLLDNDSAPDVCGSRYRGGGGGGEEQVRRYASIYLSHWCQQYAVVMALCPVMNMSWHVFLCFAAL